MSITKQQVFDAAWNGLKAQGFIRTDEFKGHTICIEHDLHGYGASAYGPAGLKCAFAHAVGTYTSYQVCAGLGNEATKLALVNCHQLATSPADMERRLREFAAAEGLTVPVDVPTPAEKIAAIVSGPSVLTELEHAVEVCVAAGDRMHARNVP